jgi:hypothetical protein
MNNNNNLNEEYNTLGELPKNKDMPKLRGFEEGRPVRKSLPVRNDLDTYVVSLNNTPNFMSSEVKLRTYNVISYNLSWATQLNKAAGTEKLFVEWCKKQNIKSTNPNFENWCTQNGLDGIIEYIQSSLYKKSPIEFIGFQECTKHIFEVLDSGVSSESLFLTYLNKKLNPDIELKQINSDKFELESFVSLFYNTELYEEVEKLSGDMDPDSGRPCLICSFQNKFNDYKTIVCVVHATHDANERDAYINGKLIPEMYKMSGDNEEERVLKSKFNRFILMGDFNGLPKFYYDSMMFKNYPIENLPNSCCWQAGHGSTFFKDSYNGISDIIYDSAVDPTENKVSIVPRFGPEFSKLGRHHKQHISTTNSRGFPIYTGSDHLPVCLRFPPIGPREDIPLSAFLEMSGQPLQSVEFLIGRPGRKKTYSRSSKKKRRKTKNKRQQKKRRNPKTKKKSRTKRRYTKKK